MVNQDCQDMSLSLFQSATAIYSGFYPDSGRLYVADKGGYNILCRESKPCIFKWHLPCHIDQRTPPGSTREHTIFDSRRNNE
jgi:hypothetical protein